jgi:hypothetical protein
MQKGLASLVIMLALVCGLAACDRAPDFTGPAAETLSASTAPSVLAAPEEAQTLACVKCAEKTPCVPVRWTERRADVGVEPPAMTYRECSRPVSCKTTCTPWHF